MPDQIGTILGQAGLPAGWAGTVIDAKERDRRAHAGRQSRQCGRNDARRPGSHCPRQTRIRCAPRRGRAWMSKPCTACWRARKAGRSMSVFPCRTECAGIPLAAAIVRRNGGERRACHRARTGDRPRNRATASHGGAAVGGCAARQRKARGACHRCRRTRYVALGPDRERVQRLQSFRRIAGLAGLPIRRNPVVRGPDFRVARTAASRGSGLVRRRLPRERQIKQRRISGSIATIAANTGCARREGRKVRPTGVM